jgi:hypothetical protein
MFERHIPGFNSNASVSGVGGRASNQAVLPHAAGTLRVRVWQDCRDQFVSDSSRRDVQPDAVYDRHTGLLYDVDTHLQAFSWLLSRLRRVDASGNRCIASLGERRKKNDPRSASVSSLTVRRLFSTSAFVASESTRELRRIGSRASAVDDVEFAARLDRIQKVIDELARVRSDAIEQQELTEWICREIHAATAALRPTL